MDPAIPLLTDMNAIKKMDKQIELEQTASAIYKKLGTNAASDELKTLWNTLSLHEEYHAIALERLKSTLSEEELEKEASTLDEKNIETLLAEHRKIMDEIEGEVSVKRSFEIAIFMEFSELNSIFFNSVTSDPRESSSYIHSMGEGTRSHLMTLYRGIKKFLGKNEQLPYIEKFREFDLIQGV